MKTASWCLSIIVLLVILNIGITNAQKLPNTQKSGVRAPENIKIDGKTTEWNDTFQAYNKTVDIFYTISNDDNNIYLTARAKYKDIIDKILRSGITFTINFGLNKKDKNRSVSITYPVLEGPDMWVVVNKFAQKVNEHTEGAIKITDLNELFYTKEKTIKVTGIEAIVDPAISIYNTNGIKSASLFDDNLTYTYELAIPIAYLKLTDNGAFKYNIKISEPPQIQRPLVINSNTPPPPPPVPIGTLATTDFWGEYILKK